jgi:serine/threonine protein kinase
MMRKHGQALICCLIKGLQELKGLGVVLRNIQPKNIFVSTDCAKLVFNNILSACSASEQLEQARDSCPPYSNTFFRSFREVPVYDHIWDNWSVGIIILEILAGTEVVTPINSFNSAEKALTDCEPYLDKATFKLLLFLILCDEHVDLGQYLACSSQDEALVCGCVVPGSRRKL